MFLNKYKFVKTVKFRVALVFGILYVVSGVVGFTLAYGYIKSSSLERFYTGLKNVADELTTEYFVGDRIRQFGTRIDVRNIAPRELEIFRSRLPGFVPVLAFENAVGDRYFQTVFGEADSGIFMVRLEHDDNVFSRRITEEQNLPAVRKSMNSMAAEAGRGKLFFIISNTDGKIIAGTPLPAEAGKDPTNISRILDKIGKDKNFYCLVQPLSRNCNLTVGKNVSQVNEQLEHFTSLYTLSLGLIMLPALICGYLTAGYFIAGVNRVREAANRIAAGDFTQRVSPGREGEEIDEMVDTFNRMAENTEKLLDELRVVTDNIAHDLRTPITRIRGIAEVTVTADAANANYREALGIIAEDCDNMVAMINNMLEITRTESRLNTQEFAEQDFRAMLDMATEMFEPLASEKELTLHCSLCTEPVILHGDKYKLQRLIANLLDNAIKFTPEKGDVSLSLAIENRHAVLRVQDSGTGVADADKKRIFERFYRCDSSRTKPGNGLGLPMVRAIVTAHSGTIEVLDAPEHGTIFEVKLPLAV